MHGGRDEKHQSAQSVTPVPPPLSIVADDLTGACDAAVAFAAACHPVRAQIIGDPPTSSRIQAMTTESRGLPTPEADARIRNIAMRFQGDTEIFKKIDSVFRGNTVAEIAATLRHVRFDLAILAPAYPALRRTIHGGILHIHDSAGDRTIPIAEFLTNAGCSFTSLPPSAASSETLATAMRHRISSPPYALLFDTATQDDLTQIVRAARSLGKRILWIGSGGLAHALAAELPALPTRRASNPRPGRTIFFIGSPHPVTRAQVDCLCNITGITEHRSDAPHTAASDLLIHVMLGETSADDIRQAIAAHDPSQIGCLFMTGGDTAHFICRSLGIRALLLEREFAPGVPLAIAEGGPFDGVSVVLKSGGFGEPDLLRRLLETCRQEVPA